MSGKVIKRIVDLLEENNTQDKELCDYIGVAQSTFVNWKNRGTDPKPKYLSAIAKFFNVSTDYLLDGTGKSEETYINEVLNNLLCSLDNGTGLYPSGKAPQTPAEKEALINSIKLVMNTVDHMDRD